MTESAAFDAPSASASRGQRRDAPLVLDNWSALEYLFAMWVVAAEKP